MARAQGAYPNWRVQIARVARHSRRSQPPLLSAAVVSPRRRRDIRARPIPGYPKRGLPRALLSDAGSAIIAAETTEGLERLSIVHFTSLPYTPCKTPNRSPSGGKSKDGYCPCSKRTSRSRSSCSIKAPPRGSSSNTTALSCGAPSAPKLPVLSASPRHHQRRGSSLRASFTLPHGRQSGGRVVGHLH